MNSILSALVLASALAASPALAAGDAHTVDHDFSFEGPLGVYDQGELQRGLQVYRAVCGACHGMKYVPIRTIGDKNGPGLAPAQVKAIAAEYDIQDETKEVGETRSRLPSDHFPTVTSAGAPDMSLLAKARAGGPAHIYSILTGYTGEEKTVAGATLYENTAYPGGWISMGPPLYGDDLEYADGTEPTIENLSHDVSVFLAWAADPHMVDRKQAGIRNILFLTIFGVLLYFVNRRIWKKVKHPE